VNPQPVPGQAPGGFLRDEQYAALAQATAGIGVWLRTLFELGVTSSIGKGELLDLKVRHINLEEQLITFPGETKNGQGRNLRMTSKVFELISELIRGKAPEDYVFTRERTRAGHKSRNGGRIVEMREEWRQSTEAAGYPGLLFRDLRRTGRYTKVSAEDLELYRSDPLREEKQEDDFVVCRGCGAKLQRLDNHVPACRDCRNQTLEKYCEEWNYPPVISEISRDKSRQRAIDSLTRNGGDPFKGKGHNLLPGERGRRGKPATPEMQRGFRKTSEKKRGIPQSSSSGKAPDTAIVLLKFEGKSALDIAREVGRSDAAVGQRYKDLGLPLLDCRFFHGEPLAQKHLDDLCSDFGLTAKQVTAKDVIRIVGAGRSKFLDKSLRRHLSRLGLDDVVRPQFADVILDLRKRWTEKGCVKSSDGEEIRDFVASEIRDLRLLSELLKAPITELRNWLWGQNGNVQPLADLQWICDQARLETAGKIAGQGFHTLLFLWPALKDLNDKRPGLLAGRQPIGEVIDELLGLDYGAPAERIHHAASGELRELDPQDLGKRIMSELAADRAVRQAAERKLKLLQAAQAELGLIMQSPEDLKVMTVGKSVLQGAAAGRRRKKAPEKKTYFAIAQQVDHLLPAAIHFLRIKAALSPKIRGDGRLFRAALTKAGFSEEDIGPGLIARTPQALARHWVANRIGKSFDWVKKAHGRAKGSASSQAHSGIISQQVASFSTGSPQK